MLASDEMASTGDDISLRTVVSALARDVAIPAPQFIIALTCMATLMAGLMQVAGGIFRVGQLVRFVPYPVIAGFTHGISLILFVVVDVLYSSTAGSMPCCLRMLPTD